MAIDSLSFAEKYLILAHHPDKNTYLASDIHLNYGVSGAILMQLATNENIVVSDKKVEIKKHNHPKDEILREVLLILDSVKKTKSIKYWISRVNYRSKKFRKHYQQNLIRKLIFKEEKRSFLFIPYSTYKLTDKNARYQLINHLQRVIQSKEPANQEDQVLLGLIDAGKLHKILVSEQYGVKEIKKILQELRKDHPMSEAVDQTIKETQAAIIGVITAASIVTTTSS